MALESSILSPSRLISGSKSSSFLYYSKQTKLPTKVLLQNNRYPFRLASNCIGTSDFRRFLGPRCEGIDLFTSRARLRALVQIVRVRAKSFCCGGCGQCRLRGCWQEHGIVEQGLILAALLGLSAFFSVAETSITTLWPWKVRELAEKEPENSVFRLHRNDVTRFLTTILIGKFTHVLSVVNIGEAALVTEAATAIFGEACVIAATGVMTGFQVMQLAAAPNLIDYIPCIAPLDLPGFTKRVKAVNKVFDDFFEKIIEEHLQSRDDLDPLLM
ncbi:hypothetical protein M0R45_015466 [Rubus argutus]|uniref:CNNM transmembrane domain-containing protein n=1 Tax=Rubus argutus TaxID=59490 RepID=A0AAW1XS32_RUBAR